MDLTFSKYWISQDLKLYYSKLLSATLPTWLFKYTGKKYHLIVPYWNHRDSYGI